MREDDQRVEVDRGRAALAVGLLCVVGVITGCGSSGEMARVHAPSTTTEVRRPQMRVETADIFRFDSLEDLVSFSDHVVVLSVTDEVEFSNDQFANDPYIQRQIDASVVEVLYSYPNAPALPMSLEILTDGSMEVDGGTIVDLIGDGPRLEVGHQYAAALTSGPSGDWSFYSSSAIFEVSGGVILGLPGDHGIRERTAGSSVSEFEGDLTTTEMNPEIDPSSYVAPVDRFLDLFEEQ